VDKALRQQNRETLIRVAEQPNAKGTNTRKERIGKTKINLGCSFAFFRVLRVIFASSASSASGIRMTPP
jgi:hypothetical protein